MKRVYLASPYSSEFDEPHSRRWDHKQRWIAVCKAVAALMRKYPDILFYSPIAHSHGIAVHGGIAGDYKAWQPQNHGMLDIFHELWILKLPGWDASKGIADEEAYNPTGVLRRVEDKTYEVETVYE